MPHSSVIYELAEELGGILKSRKIRVAVAESCTGGVLSATMTAIPGSSNWFDRGFITYSNESKEQLLGVPHRIIRAHGAVSEQTARAMAEGVIAHSHVDVSVAITGIAGPGGGSEAKPVGTVWIAWAGDMQPTFSHCYQFQGNRPAIRHQAVEIALEGLIHRCDPKSHLTIKKKSKETYFFAVFPKGKVADALYKQGVRHLEGDTCSIIEKSKLHMTLCYLGNVPPDFVQEAMRIASSLKGKSFTLDVNKVDSWRRPKICWLGGDSSPSELTHLVYQLNKNLISAGFKPESKPFSPHITIARKCAKKGKAISIPTTSWVVDSFCLVKSTQKSGSTHYESIASWPLK